MLSSPHRLPPLPNPLYHREAEAQHLQEAMPMFCFQCIFSNYLSLFKSKGRRYKWNYTGIVTQSGPLTPSLAISSPLSGNHYVPLMWPSRNISCTAGIRNMRFCIYLKKININLWQVRLVSL